MNLPKITNNNFDEIFNVFTGIVLQAIDKHGTVMKFFYKQKKLKKRGLQKPY